MIHDALYTVQLAVQSAERFIIVAYATIMNMIYADIYIISCGIGAR